MLTEWRPIEEFPTYSVSTIGTVRNEETKRQMTMLVNQRGVVNVGLTRNCRQYKRAVGLLVAKAYLERPNNEFDCAINLDGDRYNNAVWNIEWRPKWFAVEYNEQMEEYHFEDYHPIINEETGERFVTPWHAVRRYGILHRDLILAIANRRPVWPIRQHFREDC